MIELLRLMKEKDASDLHLTVGVPPQLRINKEMVPTNFSPLTKEDTEKLVYSILNSDQIKKFEETKELDFSFGVSGIGRFRINIFRQRGSIGAAIRLVPFEIPSFEELGLSPEVIISLIERTKGLILVTGPAGSGKSTTLAAMVDYINRTRRCHIISIEDPIEYLHSHKKSIVNQRELGEDTNSFAEALKHVLRQDPDVVLIGEMRDLETISAVLTVAETGHLVMTTLHTPDAAQSINRIVDVFPPYQQSQVRSQLSLILIGVISQQLLPRADGGGLVLAKEIMIVTPAIQNLIRENQIEQIYSHLQMGTKLGMCTMNASLAELVKQSLITPEVALSRSTNPKELEKMLEKQTKTYA